MKTMKKYSIILSAVLSVFALASCQKEQDIKEQDIIQEEVKENVPSSVPFVLRANIPSVDTKTTLNISTWALNWESTDVIYAVTTDKAWGQDYEDDNSGETIAVFAYDSESGTFSTDKAISDGDHTFNFLYTAGNQKSYHRGGSTTFQLASTQTFDASAPSASLKLYDALAAQVVATTPTSFADVDMSHLFSLMKVTLKNKTGDAVNITKFEIEIPGEKLYGIFNVIFNTTPSTTYNRNGGDKITVNISNGTVAADGTLDVYFVMGPVAGYTGEVTFTVTDSASNTYTKTNTISAPGVTFAAGTYNTASYSLKPVPVQCVTLDWNYAGGTSSDLLAIPGVSANGLGSDYAESHAPYRVKFDGTGDYIQVRTDAAISTVSVGYKMIGGNTTSNLTFKESANGSDWTDVQTLVISSSGGSTGTLTTTNHFNEASRFVQIYFTKGSNVGIGAISITKLNTDPAIEASDIYDVPAIGCTDESSTYTALNFTDDVEVGTVTGCVSDADAATGDIFYSVMPNYESTEATGTIVLQSAGNNAITKTITVHQLGSSLTVSTTEVIIPSDDDEATFTITSPEFDWSITADDDSHVLYDASGNASNSASTVTVTSDLEATDAVQTIATLTIIRNSNNSDPQAKQVVIKKAAAGEVSYTVTFPDDNSSSNGLSSYTDTWTAMAGSFSLSITNFNNNTWNNNWTFIKCGRKNNASVATIITDSAISEAIKTIKITIDALTASKINSIILYISSDGSSWAEGGTFTKATGEQSVTISNPLANRYYKLVFDCASGSNNGLLTLSKIVYTTK